MISPGERAPDFELPGVGEGTVNAYQLKETLADDRAVLLVFYPFDFSPVCTNELCAIRNAKWFEFTPGLEVWDISGDSIYQHDAFIEQYDLNLPVLSDSQGTVTDEYDVCYDEFEHYEAVPKRSVSVIDPTQTGRYAWATDDAYKKPDFAPVKVAVDELSAIDDSLAPDDLDSDVNYEAGLPE